MKSQQPAMCVVKPKLSGVRQLFSCFLVLAISCGVQSSVVSAQFKDVPLPRKRPATLLPPVPLKTEKVPAPMRAENVGDDFDICLRGLKVRGVEFVRLEPFGTDKGCHVFDPVGVSAIRQGGHILRLSAKPVLSCRFAEKLTTWLADVGAPIFRKFTKASLAAISSGPGYVCRNRNNRRGGKLSEHAFGNALDITDFRLTDGRRVAVSKVSNGTPVEKRMLQALRITSCGYFTTVLGPGSNAAHKSHFHLDYGKHGRTWNYRICE